jgi:hypothetical protein
MPVGRIGGRFAVEGYSRQTDAFYAVDPKRLAVNRNKVVVNTPVPGFQHFKNWETRTEILGHHIGAIDIERTTLTQKQQSRCVVNLTIG